MAVRCPECGSDEVHPITPGYFECRAQIVVGGIPPSVTGLPHHLPGFRPCGTYFQVGTSAPAQSCALCGFDSVGTCEGGCGRRLCGKHGTKSPPFLCRACLERKVGEQQREKVAAHESAVRTQARRHDEVLAQALGSDDRTEIATLLNDSVGVLTTEDGKKVWQRLLDLGQIPPTHEMATMAGTPTLIGSLMSRSREHPQRGSWVETGSRRDLWFAPRDTDLTSRGQGDGFDAVLDVSGNLFRAESSARLRLRLKPATERIMLDKGQQWNLVPSKSAWDLVDGRLLRGWSEDAVTYVRAVAVIAAGHW
jgi:hypothetical protein